MTIEPSSTVLIVGAGAFGASTALALCDGPYRGREQLITILERSAEVGAPAIDAASHDYNKIIRQDYTDPFYAELARQALARWRTPDFSQNYHECGVMVGSSKDEPEGTRYVQGSLAVNSRPEMVCAGKKAYSLDSADEIKKCYPGIQTGAFERHAAYLNEAGGWAASGQAVIDVLTDLSRRGVKIISGEAISLTVVDQDVKGVKTREGNEYRADLVILAAGAWTSQLLPELAHNLLPTGQVVGTILLTEEEARRYADVPVTLLLDTGFYCFPPTHDRIFKFAIHGGGWLDTTSSPGLPSVPRTSLTPGCEHQKVPASAVAALKAGLKRVYPELAEKEWLGHRLCWYTDRHSGDWLIDYHPSYPSLFLATGGSGHAFKFFPLLGDLVLNGLERRLSPQEKSYWSYEGDESRIDKSRGETTLVRQILDPVPTKAKL